MQQLKILLLGLLVMSSSPSQWNSSYHTNSETQFAVGKQGVDSLGLKGDERVLDVGCGTGRTTDYCASEITSGTVHGTDISEEMIEFAKQEYSQKPQLSFECVSAAELSYDQVFDAVYSFFCLQWVKEQQTVIGNIVRALKQGGTGLLYINCANELTNKWIEACATVKQKHPLFAEKSSEHFFFQSPETWATWITAAGGAVEKQELIKRTKMFESRDELRHSLGTLNIEPALNDSEREEFIDLATRELYRLYELSLDAPFEYPVVVLALRFTRSV